VGRAVDLERAVGRLIVGRVAGTALDNDTGKLLQSGVVGGVCLFKNNVSDLEGLVRLIFDIRQAIGASETEPHISADQEGGPVQRFDHVISPLPSLMALAATGDPEHVIATTKVSVEQLKLAGLSCVLSPNLDVFQTPINPVVATRSFGDDPEQVAELGALVLKTITESGLLAMGKHFPGHGATKEDSHVGFATDHSSAESLWAKNIAPFKQCLDLLPAILVGHMWIKAVDSEQIPASLSPKVITGILRQYLKFDRLIVCDDLLMKAITDQYGLAEAAVLSVEAGADQVLPCGTVEEMISVHKALLEAVKSGRISESRLESALARIDVAFAKRKPALYATKENEIASVVRQLADSTNNGRRTSLQASLAAIASLRGGITEDFSGKWVVVAPDHPRYKLDLAQMLRGGCGSACAPKDLVVNEIRYPLNPTASECKSIRKSCNELGRDTNIIYLTFRTLINKGQRQLGEMLHRTGNKHIHVACDVPHDTILLPEWENCLCTFDPSDLAMEALASLLVEGKAPQGNCPVKLEMHRAHV
jgi:beta-N-acetylhexosaminidase